MARNLLTTELVKELASHIDTSTHLVTPDSPDYECSNARWSDAAVKSAGAVAFPHSAEEVSKLLVFASEHQLEMTVKGGGHSTSGNSSTNGGLVIDLSKMRRVTVDPIKKIINAQGGALWSDVDQAGSEYNLATVGGTVEHTGIGGLTLGGGFGWLSGMYGASVDTLVSVQVVIANGQILEASENENSDLFWAIRGAGHNFGVVTEFRYQAYDQPNPIYAGRIIFTPDKIEAVVGVLNEVHARGDPRGAFQSVFTVPPGAPGPLMVVLSFYNGDEAAGKAYLASLIELGPAVVDLKPMPYIESNRMLNAVAMHGGRKSLKGGTFTIPVRREFVRWMFDEFNNKIKEEPEMGR